MYLRSYLYSTKICKSAGITHRLIKTKIGINFRCVKKRFLEQKSPPLFVLWRDISKSRGKIPFSNKIKENGRLPGQWGEESAETKENRKNAFETRKVCTVFH